MKVEQFLCVDGVEVANGNRLRAYLRAGLGNVRGVWTVKNCDCDVLANYLDPYSDTYSDTYEAVLDPFTSPADDPAPWYVAANPASAEFLGVWIEDLDDRAPNGRTAKRLASGGAVITPYIPSERTAGFTVQLIASSERGMEYGRRWLTDVVLGGACSWEGTSEFQFLPFCPVGLDNTRYRSFVRAATIDAPTFSPIGNVGECYVMNAVWQIAAGVPWLVGPSNPDGDANETSIDSGQTVSIMVSTDEWVGDTAVDITIVAGIDNADGVIVSAYPMAEGWTCPEPGSPNTCYRVECTDLPPYAALELLASRDEANFHNPTSKTIEPAWQRTSIENNNPFLYVPPCSSVCVQIHNGSISTIVATVATSAREL